MYVNLQSINTLKEDVKSLTQLVIVIKDLADNEVDNRTLNYYGEMIYSMNRSIVALNNFVSSHRYQDFIRIRNPKLFTTDCSISD